MNMELEEKIAGEIVLSDHPGLTIKKWREQFKVSQQELSKIMKISSSVISDYETGRRKSPGVSVVKRIVASIILVDKNKGGEIIKRYTESYGSDAILDIREFKSGIKASEIVEKIEGKNYTENIDLSRILFGYTIIDSIKAILSFNAYDYLKIYGWSNERALIFEGVKYGRSPLIAIRAHPLKPALIVFARPDNVDPLAIKLAELENIPLVSTKLDIDTLINRLRKI
ncbi:MAG: helix-turn-helix domain-containing protein [Thermoplasmata archaeon]